MSDADDPKTPTDPKEAMRQALERKRNAQHTTEGVQGADGPIQGGPHRQAAGKRQFRRKAGG